MNTRRDALLSILSVSSIALFGCASYETKPAANMGALNSSCPFSGNKANKDVTSKHNGKTVAFCCNGCKAKFDSLSDAEKAAMVKSASAAN